MCDAMFDFHIPLLIIYSLAIPLGSKVIFVVEKITFKNNLFITQVKVYNTIFTVSYTISVIEN